MEFNEEGKKTNSKNKNARHNKSKIKKIDKEINKINYLIKNAEKKLLKKEKTKEEEGQSEKNNADNKLFYIKKEINSLNLDKNKNLNYIGKKTKREIKIHFSINNGSLKKTKRKQSKTNEKKYTKNNKEIKGCFLSKKSYLDGKNIGCNENENKEKNEIKINEDQRYFYNEFVNNNNGIDFLINHNIDKKEKNLFSLENSSIIEKSE